MQRILKIVIFVFLAISMIKGVAHTECGTCDVDSLNLTLPCVECNGVHYQLGLEYYHNPADPLGFYWKFSYLNNPLSDLMLIENMNAESPIMSVIANTATKESISIVAEKDQLGYPIKITGAVYISEEGDFAKIQIGNDGLPTSLIDSLGNKITFENFTDSTVIISVFSSAGELVEGPTTLSLNPTKISEIKQLLGNISFNNENILAAKLSSLDECFENLISLKVHSATLKGLGLTFGWIFCVGSAVSGNIPMMSVACGSVFINSISAISKNKLDDVWSTRLSLALCSGGDIQSCIPSLFDLYSSVFDSCLNERSSPHTFSEPTPTATISNSRPSISVKINSSATMSLIVRSSIKLIVDDRIVDHKYSISNNLKTVTISYNIVNDLSPGEHSVFIQAYDVCCRIITYDWKFIIEEGEEGPHLCFYAQMSSVLIDVFPHDCPDIAWGSLVMGVTWSGATSPDLLFSCLSSFLPVVIDSNDYSRLNEIEEKVENCENQYFY